MIDFRAIYILTQIGNRYEIFADGELVLDSKFHLLSILNDYQFVVQCTADE